MQSSSLKIMDKWTDVEGNHPCFNYCLQGKALHLHIPSPLRSQAVLGDLNHVSCFITCIACGVLCVLLFMCFVFWGLFLSPSCLWDWITKSDSPGTVPTWELKWLHKQVKVLSKIPQTQGNGLCKTKASSTNFSGTIWVWLVWDQGSYLAPICHTEEQL